MIAIASDHGGYDLKERVDRKLCRAAHKWCQKNCHLSVTFR